MANVKTLVRTIQLSLLLCVSMPVALHSQTCGSNGRTIVLTGASSVITYSELVAVAETLVKSKKGGIRINRDPCVGIGLTYNKLGTPGGNEYGGILRSSEVTSESAATFWDSWNSGVYAPEEVGLSAEDEAANIVFYSALCRDGREINVVAPPSAIGFVSESTSLVTAVHPKCRLTVTAIQKEFKNGGLDESMTVLANWLLMSKQPH